MAADAVAPSAPTRTRTAGRRLGIMTVDQVISSASNFLITILAAGVLEPRAFGLFSIVFLTMVATQGFSRAVLGDPLLIHPQESEERPGEAIGTTLTLGVCIAGLLGVMAGIAAVWDRGLATGLLVLAVATPMLMLVDLGRYLAFATHRPARALTLDLTWLALLIVLVPCLALADLQTLTWFIAVWAGTGSLAALLVLRQHRGARIVLGFGWLRRTWSFSWRYAVSFLAAQGAVLISSVGMIGILGASSLGAIRGVLLLFGPLMQFQAVVVAAGVTEVTRMCVVERTPLDSSPVRRHVLRWTALTTAAASLNLALLMILPDSLGELLLGDTWKLAKTLLFVGGLRMVFLCLITGVRSTLLGARAVRKTMRLDVTSTVILIVVGFIGALVGGVEGAMAAMAGAQAVIAVLWWVTYRRHASTNDVGDSMAAVPGTTPVL